MTSPTTASSASLRPDLLHPTDSSPATVAETSSLIALTSSLASAPSLRRLDLGYNNLGGDAGAGAVASAFPSGWAPPSPSWTSRETPSGTREPRRLARALEECIEGVMVRSLTLRSNAIGDAGMEALRVHVAAGTARLNFMPARWTVPGPATPDEAVADVAVTV